MIDASTSSSLRSVSDSSGRIAASIIVAAASVHLPSFDTDSSPPEWVHLIPAGTFFGRDGRGPYTLDAEAIIAAFARHGADLPVDFEHQSLTAHEKSGPIPAAGWITALEARPTGLWARVQWTEQAAQMLAQRQYRYLSPVFRVDPATGNVIELIGAGLTHMPNLHLAAAASREDTRAAPSEHQTSPALPEGLAEALGVTRDASPADVVAAARALRLQAEAPDPTQWVPMTQHQAALDEASRLRAEIARRDAMAAVDEAMRAGKIVPAQREWALRYALSDAEGFRAFCASAPVVGAVAQITPPPVTTTRHSRERVLAMAEKIMTDAEQRGQTVRFSDALAQAMRTLGAE